MSYQNSTGVTLLELLITLAIVSISFSLAVPGLSAIKQKNDVLAAYTALIRHIHFARNQAVTTGQYITLCGSHSGDHCDGRWSDGYLVFVDTDKNGQLNEEVVLRFIFISLIFICFFMNLPFVRIICLPSAINTKLCTWRLEYMCE